MRDFRDAKAMAHTLRDALKVKAVETTHSECLELIARAFGYENWNILSAKIEAARSSASDAGALHAAATTVPEPDNTPANNVVILSGPHEKASAASGPLRNPACPRSEPRSPFHCRIRADFRRRSAQSTRPRRADKLCRPTMAS